MKRKDFWIGALFVSTVWVAIGHISNNDDLFYFGITWAIFSVIAVIVNHTYAD